MQGGVRGKRARQQGKRQRASWGRIECPLGGLGPYYCVTSTKSARIFFIINIYVILMYFRRRNGSTAHEMLVPPEKVVRCLR